MSDITINITGLAELLTRTRGLSQEVQEEVDGEVIDFVMRVNAKQRRLAPKDQGGLVRGIGYERKHVQDETFFEMFSNSEHSGYMEFGTRYRVRVPGNLTAVADQMRGQGITSRLKAKQAIYAWCKRKGIEPRAWYPIFIAIMTVGVLPHPFFFQPFFDEQPMLLDRIERLINENRQL